MTALRLLQAIRTRSFATDGFVLQTKGTKRESTCQTHPAPPIPRLTFAVQPLPLSRLPPLPHAVSSPSSPPSPLPPTPTSMSHTLSHRPPSKACIAAERARDDQSSVFLFLGRRRFQRALASVYLKTHTTIREERERRGRRC